MLAITTPATDLQLLTIEDMRAIAGITGAAQDAALTALGLSVAASIAAECNVVAGAGGVPTLLRETCTETLRNVDCRVLVLSRRHDVAITSITVDGTALETSEFEADPETGMVTRLSSDIPIRWFAQKVVVVYAAGFDGADLPGDLAMAASDFFRMSWQEGQRDPALKRFVEDIPGVLKTEKEWWVGSVPGQAREGAVPDVVSGQLKRFRNERIG